MCRLPINSGFRTIFPRLTLLVTISTFLAADIQAASLKDIYAQYQAGLHDEAIRQLRHEIVDIGTRYTISQVDTALKMIIDFYEPSPSDDLTGIIRRIAMYTSTDLIRTGFSSSTLRTRVDAVLDSVDTPVKLVPQAVGVSVVVGEKQIIRFRLLNVYGEDVPWKNCTLVESGNPSWRQIADVDIKDSVVLFQGKSAGTDSVNFQVATLAGDVLAAQINLDVSIPAAPTDTADSGPFRIVSVYPTQGRSGNQIRIVVNRSAPTIQSIHFGERATDQFRMESDTVTIATVPMGLGEERQVSIMATWAGGVTALSSQTFTILGDVVRPSKGLVNTGRIAICVGAISIGITHLQTRNRWNDYKNDPDHSPNLYQSYLDAYNLRTAAVLGTAVAAVATYSYYYIKYRPALRRYKKAIENQNEAIDGVTISPLLSDGLGIRIALFFP